MIDLTPLDVRKKRGDFRRILRGYDPEEVDTFMNLVAERFEELVRENLALSEKNGRIESQLDALIGREKAVQEALVTAQKLREDVGNQTRRDAEVLQAQASREVGLLKAEAEAEIARRLAEAKGLVQERQRAVEELERSRLKFLKAFRGLLERELDAVEVEEARRPLEDIPVEFHLRGWAPSGTSEEGEEGEDSEAVEDEAVTPDQWVELEAALEAELAAKLEAEVEAEPISSEADRAEDDGIEVESGIDAELDEAIQDGFQTQVLEGASPMESSVLPEDESWSEVEAESHLEEKGTPSASQEPKWLFSLLKGEEDGRGGEG